MVYRDFPFSESKPPFIHFVVKGKKPLPDLTKNSAVPLHHKMNESMSALSLDLVRFVIVVNFSKCHPLITMQI